MDNFFTNYKTELIYTAILIAIFFIVRFIIKISIKKIGRRSNINEARIGLINRYVTVTLFLIALLIEAFVLGVDIKDLIVLFSSVFAILGITLFASWSVLSNVTSGIVMFFSFPYKIGDKIHIHDKEFEIIATIEDIRSFQIHLRKDNGELITYPNNMLLQKAVSLLEKDVFDK